jgi:hypothetical protein
MSPRTKTCPVCGRDNAASDFFCHNCGSEIASIPVTVQSRTAPPFEAKSPPAMRTCPECNHPTDLVLPLCGHCGFELVTAAKPKLFLLIGGESHECKNGDVIGRDGTVAKDYFSALGTVSRRHVTISEKDGQWMITVTPTVQNITKLDGTELPRGLACPLSGEHTLKLSTQCEVKLRVMATE